MFIHPGILFQLFLRDKICLTSILTIFENQTIPFTLIISVKTITERLTGVFYGMAGKMQS